MTDLGDARDAAECGLHHRRPGANASEVRIFVRFNRKLRLGKKAPQRGACLCRRAFYDGRAVIRVLFMRSVRLVLAFLVVALPAGDATVAQFAPGFVQPLRQTADGRRYRQSAGRRCRPGNALRAGGSAVDAAIAVQMVPCLRWAGIRKRRRRRSHAAVRSGDENEHQL